LFEILYIYSMKRTIVLTAITGGKDKLIDPDVVFDSCDYFAFVDEVDYSLKVWKQILNYKFSNLIHTHRRNAKVPKILSQSFWNHYQFIVWHDGTHQLAVNPEDIYDEYGNFDLLCFRHAQRRCLYQELDAIENMDAPTLINSQREYYKSVGMPEYYGMYEMGCYLRQVNRNTIDFGLAWFEQVCRFTSRDQVSFPFVLWQMENRINLKVMKGNCSQYIGTHFENDGNKYFKNHSTHII